MISLYWFDSTRVSQERKQAMVDELKVKNTVEQVLELFPELKCKNLKR